MKIAIYIKRGCIVLTHPHDFMVLNNPKRIIVIYAVCELTAMPL
jgi:hypothetical protein